MSPYIHPHIYVERSPIHGWGVFTRGFLSRGLVVERSPIIPLPSNPQGLFSDYRFGWPQNKPWTEIVIGLGYASIYNHSRSPNIEWESDEENRLLVFSTLRDIKPGEELCSFYGENYNWEERGYIEKNGQDGESENTDLGISSQGEAKEEKKGSTRQDQIFEI